MMFAKFVVQVLLLGTIVISYPVLRNKVNVTLVSASDQYCYTIANATHSIGCNGNRFGADGVVQIVDSNDDIEYIFKNPGQYDSFVPCLTAHFLQKSKLTRLSQLLRSKRVVAVLILSDLNLTNSHNYSLSGDDQCPDYKYFGKHEAAHNCKKWNPNGVGLWFQHFDKPYVVVTEKQEIDQIKRCYEDFNKPAAGTNYASYPLCAADVTVNMFLAGNSEICLRRSKRSDFHQVVNGITRTPETNLCDKCGADGGSVMSIIPYTFKGDDNMNGTTFNKDSVLLVTARLDALSLISNLNPGAETVMTGLIGMLLLAHTLGQDKDTLHRLTQDARVNGKHLVLAAINNDALGYAGTVRMLYEIENNKLPEPLIKDGQYPDTLLLEHIAKIIDMQQLGLAEADPSVTGAKPVFYAHHIQQHLPAFMNEARKSSKGVVTGVPAVNTYDLPPSTVKLFMKKRPEIEAVILTDFGPNQFENKLYHSFADLKSQFNNDTLVATLVAAVDVTLPFVVHWLTGNSAAHYNMSVNSTAAVSLVDCLMFQNNAGCLELGMNFTHSGGNSPNHIPLTVGKSSKYLQFSYHAALDSLTIFTAMNVTQGNCTRNGTAHLPTTTILTVCYTSPVFTFNSLSPAFTIPGYDFASNEYPAFTESQFDSKNHVQLHLVHSITFEATAFCIACCWLGLCIVWVVFSNKYNLCFFDPEMYYAQQSPMG